MSEQPEYPDAVWCDDGGTEVVTYDGFGAPIVEEGP